MLSGISRHEAVIAVNLFEDLRPGAVAVFRVLLGALPVLALSWRERRPWTGPTARRGAVRAGDGGDEPVLLPRHQPPLGRAW